MWQFLHKSHYPNRIFLAHPSHHWHFRHKCRPNVTQMNGRCYQSTEPRDLTASNAQRRTIYALSTPPGKAGIAVVRISGPDASLVWRNMVRPYKETARGSLPKPWKMQRCRIIQPNSEEQLDDGLAVYFRGMLEHLLLISSHLIPWPPGPNSFTTEDVIELHLHSGRAIISSVLGALSLLHFCRPAEAGEFTRRAFLGGRLDLTQVEGLKDLIDAETESQRRMAIRSAGVNFTRPTKTLI